MPHMLVDLTASYNIPQFLFNNTANYMAWELPIQLSTTIGGTGSAVVLNLNWNDDQPRTFQLVYGLNDPVTDTPLSQDMIAVVAPGQSLELDAVLIPGSGTPPGYRLLISYIQL